MRTWLQKFSVTVRPVAALAILLSLFFTTAPWSCRFPAYDIGSCLNQCEADFYNCLWVDFYYSRTPENQEMPNPVLGYLFCEHEQSTCETKCGYLNE